MAYVVRVILDIDWIPDGAGTALLGQQQADMPGIGSANAAGAIGAAQTLRLFDREVVPGGDTPTQNNFNTALSAAATALNTKMGTAGAYSGGTSTPYQLASAWATGGP